MGLWSVQNKPWHIWLGAGCSEEDFRVFFYFARITYIPVIYQNMHVEVQFQLMWVFPKCFVFRWKHQVQCYYNPTSCVLLASCMLSSLNSRDIELPRWNLNESLLIIQGYPVRLAFLDCVLILFKKNVTNKAIVRGKQLRLNQVSQAF